MAILNSEQFRDAVKAFVGDRNDDDAIAFVENMNDTFNDAENRASDTTNWKQRFEENDNAWREKYRNRFFEGVSEPEPTPEPSPKKEVKTFDDLFN